MFNLDGAQRASPLAHCVAPIKSESDGKKNSRRMTERGCPPALLYLLAFGLNASRHL